MAETWEPDLLLGEACTDYLTDFLFFGPSIISLMILNWDLIVIAPWVYPLILLGLTVFYYLIPSCPTGPELIEGP